MKQSKQAEEMLEFMSLVDKIDLNEAGYPSWDMKGQAGLPEMGPFGKSAASGPGSSNRTTPNDYTREQVVQMLDYTKKFMEKNAKQIQSWKYSQSWLNMIGSGMKEFMNLKKGDPGLEYKEAIHGGDQHTEKFGMHSYKNADKGGASQDMKGKAKGDTTNKSREEPGLLDISKKEVGIGYKGRK